MTQQKYTLNNFIVSPANEMAHKAAWSAATHPTRYSPLVLYGDTGTGKSHLVLGIAQKFESLYDTPVLYVTAKDFCAEYIFAIRWGTGEEFYNRYADAPLLIIEDLQDIAGMKYTQEELLKIMKEREAMGRPVIFSANCHPYEIRKLDEELKYSCDGGLMLEID